MFKSKQCLRFFLMVCMVTGVGLGVAGCDSTPTTTDKKPVSAEQLFLASTIGPVDAGIVDALEEAFEKETGIVMRHVGAGTGAAIELAKSGQFDLLMVHAKKLEEEFVAEGYGTERIDLMYNDFVVMGPADDPAGIKGLTSITDTLEKIAQSKVHFISRGDQSGTHVKEMELWEAANITPTGDWYEVYAKGAAGNAATLNYTDKQQAYTIIDRATYLTLQDEINLQVLMEKDELMLNYITLIPINPEKFPSVKHELTRRFIDFVTGKDGQTIIKEFGVDKYGQPLFFPNSPVGKKL